jgi:hypothetical protein
MLKGSLALVSTNKPDHVLHLTKHSVHVQCDLLEGCSCFVAEVKHHQTPAGRKRTQPTKLEAPLREVGVTPLIISAAPPRTAAAGR